MDVMIDIETLGQSKRAVVMQIAAVKFTAQGAPLPEQPMADSPTVCFVNVDIQSAIDIGMEIDGSTVYWWLGQSTESRKALFEPPAIPIQGALARLKKFIDWRTDRVWSKGSDYDLAILDSASKLSGDKWGINSFGNNRCVRTIYDIAHLTDEETAVPEGAHNALYDAWHQARMVQEAYRRITVQKALA